MQFTLKSTKYKHLFKLNLSKHSKMKSGTEIIIYVAVFWE